MRGCGVHFSYPFTALPLGVTYAIWSGFGAVGVMFSG